MASQSAKERGCHAPSTERWATSCLGETDTMQQCNGDYTGKKILSPQYFQGWLTSSKPGNKDSIAIRVRKEGWIEVASALRLVPQTTAV